MTVLTSHVKVMPRIALLKKSWDCASSGSYRIRHIMCIALQLSSIRFVRI